jgi:hypothetical protein
MGVFRWRMGKGRGGSATLLSVERGCRSKNNLLQRLLLKQPLTSPLPPPPRHLPMPPLLQPTLSGAIPLFISPPPRLQLLLLHLYHLRFSSIPRRAMAPSANVANLRLPRLLRSSDRPQPLLTCHHQISYLCLRTTTWFRDPPASNRKASSSNSRSRSRPAQATRNPSLADFVRSLSRAKLDLLFSSLLPPNLFPFLSSLQAAWSSLANTLSHRDLRPPSSLYQPRPEPSPPQPSASVQSAALVPLPQQLSSRTTSHLPSSIARPPPAHLSTPTRSSTPRRPPEPLAAPSLPPLPPSSAQSSSPTASSNSPHVPGLTSFFRVGLNPLEPSAGSATRPLLPQSNNLQRYATSSLTT